MNKSAAAFGCLLLFAVPFGAGGLLLSLKAWRNYADYRDLALIQAGLAAFLLLIAIMICRTALAARASAAREAAVRAKFPSSPWMWREDWASRRIPAKESPATKALWFFAILWNLISLPILLVVLPREWANGNRVAAVMLILPIVGVLLFAYAIRGTMRRVRFGDSFFLLNALPIPVGRTASGSIEIERTIVFAPEDVLVVTLNCIRRVIRGSGKHQSVIETVLWSGKQEVPSASIAASGSGGAVAPVSIAIPGGHPQTDDTNPRDSIVWRLTAEAAISGVDYHASFELPVFGGAVGSVSTV